MSIRPRKALIIGAGIAGPVAAILLRRAGIESAIYEARPYSNGIGGGLQIAPNGMHVMDEIGLANELINRGWSRRPSISIRRADRGSARSTATWRGASANLPSTSAAPR